MSAHEPYPSKGAGTEHFVLHDDGRTAYTLPAYGFLERIEIVPKEDAPNFDAQALYRLQVDLYAPDGHRVPVHVELICRDLAPIK